MSQIAVAATAADGHERFATIEALDRLERMLREYADRVGEAAAQERNAALELHTAHRTADLLFHATNREADARALALRALEVEGRLANLNNENQRIAKILEQSIPREIFEAYKDGQRVAAELVRREAQTWKDDVNKQLTVSQTTMRNTVYVVGVVVSLISIAARFIKLG